LAQPGEVLRQYRTPILWLGGFLLFFLFVIINRDLATFLSYLALGIPYGAIIALIAVGYSMVYGIIQLINFAHGEVFMFSTYFALMFLVPVTATGGVGLEIVAGLVALITTCATWVMLSNRIDNRLARAVVSGVVGAAFLALHHYLLPRDQESVLPFFVAVLLGIFYSCCLGVTMDVLAYRPLRNSPRLIPLITAIGISLFLQYFAQSIWGPASRDFPGSSKPALFTQKPIVLASWTGSNGVEHSIRMSAIELVIIATAIVLLIGLQLFIHRTRTGKAMRACAQDRTTASLMGVRVNHVVAVAFALGAGLAAVAAPLYVLGGRFMSPTMGYIVGILAFSSAVLGGIGNIKGAMLGGLIIGVIYQFVPLFDRFDTFRIFNLFESWGWTNAASWNESIRNFGSPGQYQLGVAYAFMILVIVFKPTGLLGKASAKRA